MERAKGQELCFYFTEHLHLIRAEVLDIKWKMGGICKAIALEMGKLSRHQEIWSPKQGEAKLGICYLHSLQSQGTKREPDI